MRPGAAFLSIPFLLLASSPLPSQGSADPDANPATLTVTTINPNYTQGGVSYYRVSSLQTLAPGNYRITASLLLDSGGELRIKRSNVLVRGNVHFRTNGKLYLADTTFGLENYFPREFNYWWEGGHLHTERVTIGGVKAGGLHQTAAFWLNNGTWDAFDTTVQYAGGILLGWTKLGYQGRRDQFGGTLRADGLYQGEAPDALHMSGWGDAFVKNSNFAVGLYFHADGTTTGNVTLDLETTTPIAPAPQPATVYGNPAAHQGVTYGIPGSPWRLQVENTRVPLWYLYAIEATMTSAPLTLTMRKGRNVLCNITGRDLTGSPTYGGNWGAVYGTQLPGLPSTRNPGWHPMPPSCSVRIANVTFASGPHATDDWTYILGWGVYLLGAATNLVVTGPSQIVEIWVEDGRLQLVGSRDYDMGLHGNTIEAHGTANIVIRNAAIGEFGVAHSIQALITAFGRSTITVNDVRTSDLTLATRRETEPNGSFGVDAAAVTARAAFVHPLGRLTTNASAGGRLTVVAAGPGESWDPQNLDFERIAATCPDQWSCQGSSGAGSTDVLGGSRGARSFEYQTSGASGAIAKNLTSISAGTAIHFIGRAKPLTAGRAYGLDLRDPSGTNVRSISYPGTTGTWQRVLAPLYWIAAGQTATALSFWTSGGTASARLDDFDLHLSNWWDNDSLANLDFEDTSYRDRGRAPDLWRAPDSWKVWAAQTAAETLDRRPGAAGGSKSLKLTAQARQGLLFKDLTFLKPGDILTITGWVKGVAAAGATCWVKVQIGEGANFWETAAPYSFNKLVSIPGDGAWRTFSTTFTAPNYPATPGAAGKQPYTRLNVECFGAPGNTMYLDDFQVTLR